MYKYFEMGVRLVTMWAVIAACGVYIGSALGGGCG